MEIYCKTGNHGNKILFMTATEYDKKPDNARSSLLLHCIGEQGEVYNTFTFSTTADSMKLEKIMEQFEAYFKLSGNCELEGLQELLLRNMLIIGLNDNKLQECLTESNIDLNKMVEICTTVEVTRSQVHVMQNNSTRLKR